MPLDFKSIEINADEDPATNRCDASFPFLPLGVLSSSLGLQKRNNGFSGEGIVEKSQKSQFGPKKWQTARTAYG